MSESSDGSEVEYDFDVGNSSSAEHVLDKDLEFEMVIIAGLVDKRSHGAVCTNKISVYYKLFHIY